MKRFEKFNNTLKEDKDLETQTKEVLISKLEDQETISAIDLNRLRDSIKNWLNEEIN